MSRSDYVFEELDNEITAADPDWARGLMVLKGGGGRGGSEVAWKYRDPKQQFDAGARLLPDSLELN